MTEQAHLASFPLPSMHSVSQHDELREDEPVGDANEYYVPVTEERSIFDAPVAPRAGPSHHPFHDPALFSPLHVDDSQAQDDAASPVNNAAPAGKAKRARSSEPRATAARKESHVSDPKTRLVLSANPHEQKNVEKKRRETINHGIDAIQALLPNKEANKSAILEAAARYIQELKDSDAALRENEQSNTERWAQAKFALDITVLDLSSQRDYWRNYANTVLNQKEALAHAARQAGCKVTEAHSEESNQFQVLLADGSNVPVENHDLVSNNRFAEYSKRSAEEMMAQVEQSTKRRRSVVFPRDVCPL